MTKPNEIRHEDRINNLTPALIPYVAGQITHRQTVEEIGWQPEDQNLPEGCVNDLKIKQCKQNRRQNKDQPIKKDHQYKKLLTYVTLVQKGSFLENGARVFCKL